MICCFTTFTSPLQISQKPVCAFAIGRERGDAAVEDPFSPELEGRRWKSASSQLEDKIRQVELLQEALAVKDDHISFLKTSVSVQIVRVSSHIIDYTCTGTKVWSFAM